MTAAPQAISPDDKPLSQVERVVDTFIAPTKTFTDIRRNASWWLPYILVAVSWCLMAYVADVKVGMDAIVNNQLQLSPKQAEKLDQLPPEQRAEQLRITVKGTRIFWLYIAPILALVFGAIVAGVSMGTFNFGFGAELKFSQCMAVFMYTSLPLIIKPLLAISVLLAGGNEGFTFQNPVASNLGILIDPNSHFLYNIMTAIDLFTIWSLLLAGLAYSCITRVKRGTCMAVVFAWWAIMTLFFAGLGALFA